MTRAGYIESILANFGALKRVLHGQFSGSCEQIGVSWAQLHLLVNLDITEPLTQGELAAKLHLSPGAITQLVEPLVAKKLVARTADETDRRANRISLTASGRKKIDKLKSARTTKLKDALASLSVDELATFLAIEQKIINTLSVANQPLAKNKET